MLVLIEEVEVEEEEEEEKDDEEFFVEGDGKLSVEEKGDTFEVDASNDMLLAECLLDITARARERGHRCARLAQTDASECRNRNTVVKQRVSKQFEIVHSK